jgi:hypothetical protein
LRGGNDGEHAEKEIDGTQRNVLRHLQLLLKRNSCQKGGTDYENERKQDEDVEDAEPRQLDKSGARDCANTA